MTDEQLVLNVVSGDEYAFEEITRRYNQMLNAIARKYFLVGGGTDDLMQEAMIGLYSSCNTKVCKTFKTRSTSLLIT